MCRFISIAVEDEREAKRIFGGYSLWKNDNKSFISEVDTKFKTLWVTGGHCSCELYSYPYDPVAEAEKCKRKYSRSKYRKKGCPEEKIERDAEYFEQRRNRPWLRRKKDGRFLSVPAIASMVG